MVPLSKSFLWKVIFLTNRYLLRGRYNIATSPHGDAKKKWKVRADAEGMRQFSFFP